MSLYSFDYSNSSKPTGLKIRTPMTFYPSPTSPSNDQQEKEVLASVMLQDQHNEEWMIGQQFNFCPYTETSLPSEASSSGIRTPDLTDLISPVSNQIFGYTQLLHHPQPEAVYYQPPPPPPSNNDWISQQQLIPSLSHEDHLMLLQKGYSEPSFDHSRTLLTTKPCNSPYSVDSLTQLSREQLIERVVQLELERSKRSSLSLEDMKAQQQEKSSKQPSKRESLLPSSDMYSCLWVKCTAQAPSLDKLMTHICESHIGSGKATYFCEWQDCARNKKPFMKRHKMHNHMRTHTGERPFVCTVIGCNKTFSRPDSLSTHIKTHSDIRPYLCSVPGCEKAYFHSRSLRKHIKSTHMKKNSHHSATISVRRNSPSSYVAVTRTNKMATSDAPPEAVKLDQPHSLSIPNTMFY